MIPYSDLKPQHDSLRDELRRAFDEVLDSRQFILGRFVSEFETAFADYCGVRYAIAVNSGTSALHLALLAAGVSPGDEVITVPFTFAATVATIYYCSARPVFIDIDPESYTLDAKQLASAITSRTKAIVPVHLYGQIAPDLNKVLEIGRQHGIPVIEDAAQAHGAELNGKRAGSFGDTGCFSFYPTKNLGACGEGGMITTNDDEVAQTLKLLRDWGQDRKYHHSLRAFNYRMEGIQGAVLAVKLRYLEQWTEARRAVALQYDPLLADAGVIRPREFPGMRHVYHTYTIRVPGGQRDRLREALADAGISTAIHYPIPLHLQPAYADAAFPAGSLPESERAADEVLSLPIYPDMPADHIPQVAKAVKAFFNTSGVTSDQLAAT